MRNKIRKIIYILFVFLLFFTFIDLRDVMAAEEDEDMVYIFDEADLLTSFEEDKLFEVMLPITKYGEVAFVTIDYNKISADAYAKNWAKSHFDRAGTLFLIDMDNRRIQIYSTGSMYRYITKVAANEITENVYMLAKKGEYYECARQVFEDIYTVRKGGRINNTFRYICNIILSMNVGILLTFGIYLLREVTKRSGNTINVGTRKAGRNTVLITKCEQIKYTKKRYSEASSSTGGGSDYGGGSDSGGGGSDGGGGGHSF